MIKKINAVFYSRVSTEEETQKSALKNQIKEAENAIEEKDWNLVDQYIDEGKSGTTVRKRDEYQRLLEDMQYNKFQIIVVKSQDRLMRNVKDWYLFLERLQKTGKQLYFYLEDRFYTSEDSLITGIKAILAEEYSRELSRKINNAHRNRQKNGSSVVITSKTWGYDKVGGEVLINKEEANIIKLIFEYCIKGYGSRKINNLLSDLDIKGKTGRDIADVTIRKIIRNELYQGTAIMNKLHYDFNSKQQVKQPEENWIRHENAVPPIVSKEVWEKANREMDKRIRKKTRIKVGYNKGKYSLSSKLICGQCNSAYWRRKRNSNGTISIEWRCSNYCKEGRKRTEQSIGCNNLYIKEQELYEYLLAIAERKYADRYEKITETIISLISQVLNNRKPEERIESIQSEITHLTNQKERLLEKLLDFTLSDHDYKSFYEKLEQKQERLEEELLLRIKELGNTENKETVVNRIERIRAFITRDKLSDAAVMLFIEQIDQIIIYPEEIIIRSEEVELKYSNIKRINQ